MGGLFSTPISETTKPDQVFTSLPLPSFFFWQNGMPEISSDESISLPPPISPLPSAPVWAITVAETGGAAVGRGRMRLDAKPSTNRKLGRLVVCEATVDAMPPTKLVRFLDESAWFAGCAVLLVTAAIGAFSIPFLQPFRPNSGLNGSSGQ
jgi:hypothetical protein